jgi:hypothetical protein
MSKTSIALALLTLTFAVSTLSDQAPAVQALLDAATTWLSSFTAVVQCPSSPGVGCS